MHPLLEVNSLNLSLGSKQLIDSVSFKLFTNQRTAIIGESGSGKSLTLSTIAKLLPKKLPWKIKGEILWKGKCINTLSENAFRLLRRNGLAYIPQEAMSCLNPAMKIGKQILESAPNDNPADWLDLVGIGSPHKIQNSYPHECSGGMKQRIAIAIALATRPELLLADEVTSALDTICQVQILQLIDDLCNKFKTALLIVTHDEAVANKICTSSFRMNHGAICKDIIV